MSRHLSRRIEICHAKRDNVTVTPSRARAASGGRDIVTPRDSVTCRMSRRPEDVADRHLPVAWGIRHQASGRQDGWYFEETDAVEMLNYFRGEYPHEEFILVSRTANEPAFTGRLALRPAESSQWAVRAPAHLPEAA